LTDVWFLSAESDFCACVCVRVNSSWRTQSRCRRKRAKTKRRRNRRPARRNRRKRCARGSSTSLAASPSLSRSLRACAFTITDKFPLFFWMKNRFFLSLCSVCRACRSARVQKKSSSSVSSSSSKKDKSLAGAPRAQFLKYFFNGCLHFLMIFSLFRFFFPFPPPRARLQ
jgi:hypothetical protein